MLAFFFIISYLGMGIPPVLLAVMSQSLSVVTTMIWFAAILAGATILSVALGTTRRRNADTTTDL